MDETAPTLGWGYTPSYRYEEGSFFGNLFVTGAHGVAGLHAHYCEGPDFSAGVVPGRIGAGNTNAPYTNPFGTGGRCDLNCVGGSAPKSKRTRFDGDDACAGWDNTVTVFRQGPRWSAFVTTSQSPPPP